MSFMYGLQMCKVFVLAPYMNKNKYHAYMKIAEKYVVLYRHKWPCFSDLHISVVTLGQIHKRDTTAYLLIRRRIPVSNYAADS